MPSKKDNESIDPAAMESKDDDDVDEATTQQTEPSAHADDQANAADDLLSGLCDDVLAHILGLTKHARDAVRTGALSRRWRGLWTRAPVLRFASRRWFKQGGSAHGFFAFVDDTLAFRVRSIDGGGGLEKLVICLNTMWNNARHNQQLVPASSIGAAERWIQHAMRHGVRSFHFELSLPNNDEEESEETPVLALDGLSSSAKLEAMYLDLGDAWVRLPPTVVFESLTDLTLESIKVEGDNVLLLARLVSSACCPSLWKLRMCLITLREQQNLLLEAGVLTELSLEVVDGMRLLELKTPSLRVLNVNDYDHLESLTGSAPRLEKLAVACMENHLVIIDGDFPSVSRLKLVLYSHGYTHDDDTNYGSINLLKRFSSASCLSIDLRVSMSEGNDIDIIKGRIPKLDHVRSLEAHIFDIANQNIHCDVNCAASLLTAFTHLRYLCLDFFCFNIEEKRHISCLYGSVIWKSDFICNHWKSYEISLVHLTEAKFSRVPRTITDCALRFLQHVLSGAAQLRKVTLSLSQEYSLNSGCNDFRKYLLASGKWTECHDTIDMYHSYEWRPCR